MLVLNEATCVRTGQPITNCRCGGHGPVNENEQPGSVGQTAVQYRPQPMPFPTIDWASAVDENDEPIVNAALPEIVLNNDGGRILGVPTLNFAAKQPTPQRVMPASQREAAPVVKPLGIPVIDWSQP
jgi:hypothetical protein